MSNTDLIIEERARDIGDFLVGRLIPFRTKRMVGPFIFIDHMGPSEIGPTKYMDVDQHPHTGLSTLTYLFDGEVEHRDSIGTVQVIKPGSVNWMTAGSGVTHTERTPKELRDGTVRKVHGYQIWVALPLDKEDMDPEFFHLPADQIPSWNEGDCEFRLVAGKGYGKESSLPVYSDLFMVEIKTKSEYNLNIEDNLKGEVGITIVEGSIQACDNNIGKGNMLVAKEQDRCDITIAANSHILIFGGQPFDEGRQINWNFVASTREKINEARERWTNKEFPKVPGDDTYVPLP